MAAVGGLLITLSRSAGSLRVVVLAIRKWLTRGEGTRRTVRLEIGGDALELSEATTWSGTSPAHVIEGQIEDPAWFHRDLRGFRPAVHAGEPVAQHRVLLECCYGGREYSFACPGETPTPVTLDYRDRQEDDTLTDQFDVVGKRD